MKKIVSITIMLFSIISIPLTTLADESFWDWATSFKRMKGVAPVNNATYKEECGACHFPYQPGLLPAASWKKLVDAKALEDHFGDSAELDEDVRKQIEQYLLANAADKSQHKRSRKIMASLNKGQTPLRITDTPYIKEKHAEIPASWIKDNPKVGSLSACNNCHKKADQGIYDEDTVFIPGHGTWD